MHAVKAPAPQPVLDRPLPQPKLDQLRVGDHPMLPIGEPRDRARTWAV
jgi:hypothetical protein